MTFYSSVHLQNVTVGGSCGQFLSLVLDKEQKTGNMEKYPTDTECGNNHGHKYNCGNHLSWCIIEFISSTCFSTGAYDLHGPFPVFLYALNTRYESPLVKQALSPIKKLVLPLTTWPTIAPAETFCLALPS